MGSLTLRAFFRQYCSPLNSARQSDECWCFLTHSDSNGICSLFHSTIRNQIPCILSNRDVILQSTTGSGKTLAYLIPLTLLLMDYVPRSIGFSFSSSKPLISTKILLFWCWFLARNSPSRSKTRSSSSPRVSTAFARRCSSAAGAKSSRVIACTRTRTFWLRRQGGFWI